MTQNLLIAKLGANIAHIYIVQRLVGLQVTDLYNEWVRTVVLAIDIQLSHHYGVVGRATKRSNPPLGGCQCGGVDGECLIVGVPSGGGFQATHVRSVTELGLSVATNNLVFLSAFEEQLVLLGGSLFAEGHLLRQKLLV